MTAAAADAGKRAAAEAAAELVEDGMAVGLGTGSTVAHLLPVLARRSLRIRCAATSPATAEAAGALGIHVEDLDRLGALDLAIDGADQVAPDHWLVKGGGAAHTREKLVAAAAERFVVIVDATKLVEVLSPPVPVELVPFGLGTTLARLALLGGPTVVRDVPRSPDGGVIADHHGDAPITDPAGLAALLSTTPGVVEHGLFPPAMVSRVLVGSGGSVEDLGKRCGG